MGGGTRTGMRESSLRVRELNAQKGEGLGFIVEGDMIYGRQSDQGILLFPGFVRFEAKQLDMHLALYDQREEVFGIENLSENMKTHSRLKRRTFDYVNKLKDICRSYLNVEIVDPEEHFKEYAVDVENDGPHKHIQMFYDNGGCDI